TPVSEFKGEVYFTASTELGEELWKTDGTEGGTILVKDINPGFGSSSPLYFIEFNGHLYFNANDGVSGYEIWRTDGTEGGTELFYEFVVGPNSSDAFSISVSAGWLYICASSAFPRLWRTD